MGRELSLTSTCDVTSVCYGLSLLPHAPHVSGMTDCPWFNLYCIFLFYERFYYLDSSCLAQKDGWALMSSRLRFYRVVLSFWSLLYVVSASHRAASTGILKEQNWFRPHPPVLNNMEMITANSNEQLLQKMVLCNTVFDKVMTTLSFWCILQEVCIVWTRCQGTCCNKC